MKAVMCVSKKIQDYISLKWQPDKKLKMSLSKQIISYIKKQILNGDWLIGQKLPSQREMSRLLGVNRSTVVEAYSELIALGIIESNYGKGTVIINNTWSLMFSNLSPKWNDYIESGIHKENLPTIQVINKLEYKEGIIRLSTGEMSPSLFPHDMMKEVLNRIPSRALSLNYIEPLGLEELRIVICERMKKIGIDLKPTQILIVSGSLQALHLISMSILKPSSTMFLEEHSYLKSLSGFESNGLKMRGIPMDDFGIIPWLINLEKDEIENSILYTIPTFHNPTGITMNEERRHELIKWCQRYKLPVIEDDVYRELWFDKEPPPPLKALDTTGNVLYLGSVSKSLAPGLRIGWVAGPEPVMERLGDIKMQTDYGSSSLSQWALAEWMQSGLYDEHLKVFRKELMVRRDFVIKILETNYSDIATWKKPTGGYYIWLKLEAAIATEKLFDLAIKENLLINPGSMYSFKKNTYIRISYSYASLPDLEKGLVRLSELIRNILH